MSLGRVTEGAPAHHWVPSVVPRITIRMDKGSKLRFLVSKVEWFL